MKNHTPYISYQEATKKLEYFCAYQERCHKEVIEKLKSLKISTKDIDQVVVHLIDNNFLNEERFAQSFARGKNSIKRWGRVKIENELKLRNISKYNIISALKEISTSDYLLIFNTLAEKHWETILEDNIQKKKKKFCDYLLRKGWESDLIYEKLNDLVKSETNLD